MCVIFFAYDVHPHYRLVLAANRDEFYARPAAPLHRWQDHPEILAGQDLQEMGTWLGITRNGRLAALTNYRDPKAIIKNAPSRGNLVADFLKGNMEPAEYLREIGAKADALNGFNLLVGDRHSLYYASNRGEWFRLLQPGIYGLSNHLLNTAWPKVSSGLARLKNLMAQKGVQLFDGLEEILKNQDVPPDVLLPETGVGPVWERLLAPIFISGTTYGTRCSSILAIEKTGYVLFKEIIWKQAQISPCAVASHEIDFQLMDE
jgi:uncharacterized protein with NRDE domain